LSLAPADSLAPLPDGAIGLGGRYCEAKRIAFIDKWIPSRHTDVLAFVKQT
jgi:hypothetical protein